ncbi:MAG: hypothetical protein M3467_10140 [Actinomycetota bacterium]|nr:hypothetical protein [Actinomycetota bacterium]
MANAQLLCRRRFPGQQRGGDPCGIGLKEDSRECHRQDSARTQPHEFTAEEARAVFDERAQRLLGMGGEEFRRRWEAGELDPDDDRVLRLAMLLPLGR